MIKEIFKTARSVSRSMIVAMALMMPVGIIATPLEKDPAVREGKLANGLTYYIRHNAQTPGQADFYIAQRVGSILENPDQRGLAHFLEHMAFNGSVNFPGGNADAVSIRSWCERNGIKFGADLNAYTSIDRTVYNISNAPVQKAGVADTCLLVLHDWSNSLLLRDEEIDQERGVIREEWRTRRSGRAVQRLMEDAMPVIYQGTKYADCLPIGHIEVVDTFKYEVLRDYYKKWYRPDLQAIIVVGDVNVDEMEQKIKNVFSSIPAPAADAAERIYYPVSDNDKMILFTIQDDEQPTVNFSLYLKRDPAPRSERGSRETFVDGYKSRLAMFILRQRLAELSKEAQPRLMSCSARDASFYVTDEKDAFALNIGLFPDKVKDGIDAAIAVVEKARRYGFTEDELDHAKIQHTVSLEHRVAAKDKTRNSEFVSKIVQHFTSCEPLLSIDQEAELERSLEASVTLEEINATIRELATPRDTNVGANQVCIVYGPTKWNEQPYALPSQEDIKQWILDAEKREYADDAKPKAVDRTFMKTLPKKGKILAKKDAGNGYTEYQLSNGINVYARASEIEPARLTISMFRLGGKSLYEDKDMLSANFVSQIVTNSGAADFDKLTLEKKRAGKALRVTPYLEGEEEGVRGVCAASDLKSWLEIMHLYVTQPRRDEGIFQNLIVKQQSLLKNRSANPNVEYNDSMRITLYGRSERTIPMSLERLDKISLDRIYEIYNDRFKNMAGMSLIISGDIRTDELEDLLTQYVASLPGKKVKGQEPYVGKNVLDIKRGTETNVFHIDQKTPSALTNIIYTVDMPYTALNDLRADVLAQIMRGVYTEKVREEKGGTYGVKVTNQGWKYPSEALSISVNFRCDPDKFDELLPIIDEQLSVMAQNGPSEEQLNKIKQYLVKNYDRAVLTNGWWEYVMYNKLRNGIDFNDNYVNMVNNLTPKDIQDFCKQLVDSHNRIQVTMK